MTDDPQTDPSRTDPIAPPKGPTVKIVEAIAHGAASDGSECLIVVRTVTGQEVALRFERPNLEAFVAQAKIVVGKLRANAAASGDGDQEIAATVVDRWSVGTAQGVDATMLIIDPSGENECVFAVPDHKAVEMGRTLAQTALTRTGKLKSPVQPSLLTQRPRKLIRPN